MKVSGCWVVFIFIFVCSSVLALDGDSQDRELITTGYWPGGIPPWKGEDNQCRKIFPTMNTDNPCVGCRSGSYCGCKYVYPGPTPQFKCWACKTSDICPGNGIKYPGKKPPASPASALRGKVGP